MIDFFKKIANFFTRPDWHISHFGKRRRKQIEEIDQRCATIYTDVETLTSRVKKVESILEQQREGKKE